MVHLQESGFEVETRDVSGPELLELRESYGIPRELGSCHTAEAGGYVIEGHVPADVIAEVLSEKPDLVGLILPGMPIGAPGMEGSRQDPIEILAIDEQGQVSIYARR